MLLLNACMDVEQCMDHSPAESSAQATACALRNVPGKCRSWGRQGSLVPSAHCDDKDGSGQEASDQHDLTANLLDLEGDLGEGNFAADLKATENCAGSQTC